MTLFEGISHFAKELKNQKIPFGVIGGLAVFAYGGERTTFDIDFLIDGNHRSAIKDIAAQLNLLCINENDEVIQFSGPIQIDVLFASRSPTKGMLERLKTLPSFPFPVVSAEDLIGLKIQGFVGDRSREFRDKGDILTIFQNVANLEIDKIKEYADIFGVWNEIKELQKRK